MAEDSKESVLQGGFQTPFDQLSDGFKLPGSGESAFNMVSALLQDQANQKPALSDTMAKPSFSRLQPLDKTEGGFELSFDPSVLAATEADEAAAIAKQEAADATKSAGRKLVATTAADAALGLGLGLASLEQQEDDAFEQMSAEFGLASEQIQRNANLTQAVQETAAVNNVLQRIRALEARKPGPVQQQQFLRDPVTGALLNG